MEPRQQRFERCSTTSEDLLDRTDVTDAMGETDAMATKVTRGRLGLQVPREASDPLVLPADKDPKACRGAMVA